MEDKIQYEISEIIKNRILNDNESLKALINYDSTDNLDGLRKELIDFSSPYKRELIELWENDLLEDKKIASIHY